MMPWKKISSENILDGNKFLSVEKHSVQLPDGKIIPDWQIVITPDFVNVVAVTDENKFIIIRQYKYAVGGETLSIIGGYIEKNEIPLYAAKRELLEETGYYSDEWISLGNFLVDSNRGCGNAHLFLAKNAKKISEPDSGDLEEQEIILLTRSEVEKSLSEGEFKTLPWVTNILSAFRILDSNP